MTLHIKNIVECGLMCSKGNLFGQGLNDCANLKNRNKRMTLGLDTLCPNLKLNFGAYLGMVRIKDSYEETGYDTIKKHSRKELGLNTSK